MPYPGAFAKSTPEKPAVIFGPTGEQVTYAELNDRSIRLANLLRDSGCRFRVIMSNRTSLTTGVLAGEQRVIADFPGDHEQSRRGRVGGRARRRTRHRWRRWCG